MLKNSGQTDRIHVLKNEAQTYAWGSPGAIPSLQGRAPKPGVPEAELSRLRTGLPAILGLQAFPRRAVRGACAADQPGRRGSQRHRQGDFGS